MPSFFSRLKGKDGPTKASKKKGAQQADASDAPAKPQWDDAWTRTQVDPEEIQELLRGCTLELKSKGTELHDSHPLLVMQRAMQYIVALHELTVSHSSGYAVHASAFPTNFGSQRGPNLH
jgi:hypothetical protein